MSAHFSFAGPALLLVLLALVAVSPIFLMVAVAVREFNRRKPTTTTTPKDSP
jgi:hypothetical protein